MSYKARLVRDVNLNDYGVVIALDSHLPKGLEGKFTPDDPDCCGTFTFIDDGIGCHVAIPEHCIEHI